MARNTRATDRELGLVRRVATDDEELFTIEERHAVWRVLDECLELRDMFGVCMTRSAQDPGVLCSVFQIEERLLRHLAGGQATDLLRNQIIMQIDAMVAKAAAEFGFSHEPESLRVHYVDHIVNGQEELAEHERTENMKRTYATPGQALDVVKEAVYLAFKASGGAIFGKLPDTGETREQVWQQAYEEFDYPGGHKGPKNMVRADYVFGRMMKLTVWWDGVTVEVRNESVRSDYQSWCRTYRTYAELFDAAEAALALPEEDDSDG